MDLLSKYLADAGLTQAELARRVGVSPVAVSQWRNGECNPSSGVAFDLERISGGAIPASYWPGRRVDGRRSKPTKPPKRRTPRPRAA